MALLQQPLLVRQTKHITDVEYLARMLEEAADSFETADRLGRLATTIRSELSGNPDVKEHPDFSRLRHAVLRRRKKYGLA